MASFDFIDAAVRGYELVFRYFVYLARVALPVLFMSVLCSLVQMTLLGDDSDSLHAGLIMLPAFLVAGLYYAGLVRFALYREPIHVWGMPAVMPEKVKEDKKDIPYVQGRLSRVQSLQAGAVLYTLVSLTGAFIVGMLGRYADTQGGAAHEVKAVESSMDAAPTLLGFLVVLPILAGMVWLIRVAVIYVPVAMGFDFLRYMRSMRGLMSSISIMMMSLICFLPTVTLLMPVVMLVLHLFGPMPVLVPLVGVVLIQGVAIFIVSIWVAAMAYGINQVMREEGQKKA